MDAYLIITLKKQKEKRNSVHGFPYLCRNSLETFGIYLKIGGFNFLILFLFSSS